MELKSVERISEAAKECEEENMEERVSIGISSKEQGEEKEKQSGENVLSQCVCYLRCYTYIYIYQSLHVFFPGSGISLSRALVPLMCMKAGLDRVRELEAVQTCSVTHLPLPKKHVTM